MNQISRFVIWICSRFNREQIEMIVKELSTVLKNRSSFPSKPKSAFKEQHPHYRNFYVDKTPPLTDNVKKKPKIQTTRFFYLLIRPNTANRLSLLKYNTANLFLRKNPAHSARRLIRICITTTAVKEHNSAVKSALLTSARKNDSAQLQKPNTSAHIARVLCSAGKPVQTSLSINAPTITALTALMLSKNSMIWNKPSAKSNRLNLSYVTPIASISLNPANLRIQAR